MATEQELDALLVKPNKLNLSDATRKIIDGQPQQLAARSGLLKSGLVQSNAAPVSGFNTAIGMAGGDGLSAALQSRASERTGGFINRLKSKIDYEEPMDRLRGEKQYASNLGKSSRVDLHNMERDNQYRLDKKRIELQKQQQADSVLGSVLGIIGTVVGVALAPFTGGASLAGVAALGVAGGAVGSAVGKGINASKK